MPSKEEKQRRKAFVRKAEERERVGALARLPLSREDMQLLFDYVEERLEEEGCDNTLRDACEVIHHNGLPEDAVVAWLHEHGGFCDCEVIANVEPDWQEFTRFDKEGAI